MHVEQRPIDEIQPALPRRLDIDPMSSGTQIYSTTFDDVTEFEVQHRADDGFSTFDPRVVDGRLRMQDQTEPQSATSAFRKIPIDAIDSSIYDFDFDVFFARDPGELPADGLVRVR